MTLEQLEQKGVDPVELMKKTNLHALLIDIINTISIEIEEDLKKAGLYRHQLKQDADRLKKFSSKMVTSFDKAINDETTCINFADDSEYLYDVIKLVSEKNNHVQVLSCLKMVK